MSFIQKIAKKFGRKFNAILFPVLLFIVTCFIAWISMQNVIVKDMTANSRLSITEPSRAMLKELSDPVEIDVFVNQSDQLGGQVQELINRYQQIKSDVTLNFISPEENPDLIREHGIRFPAEMLIKYQGRTEHLQKPSEQAITNTLTKLLRGNERWLVFLSGHGERDPLGQANFDLKNFSDQMDKRGLKSRRLNLSDIKTIPDNTAALIIASPQQDLLASEWTIIKDYLNHGGNLLWMIDPDQTDVFRPLLVKLGLEFLPGTVVDAAGQKYKITQPDLIPINHYPEHVISLDFNLTTLLPVSTALKVKLEKNSDLHWHYAPLLTSSKESWTERSDIAEQIEYDEDEEHLGPLTLAMALTSKEKTQQRIVVIGDGDFISNTYIGNGGNLELGIRLFNWLSADDKLITIPSRPASDLDFELSKQTSAIIGLGFLVVLPASFALIGLLIWWRRRSM